MESNKFIPPLTFNELSLKPTAAVTTMNIVQVRKIKAILETSASSLFDVTFS